MTFRSILQVMSHVPISGRHAHETKKDWQTKLSASSLATVGYEIPLKTSVYLTICRIYGAVTWRKNAFCAIFEPSQLKSYKYDFIKLCQNVSIMKLFKHAKFDQTWSGSF
jgi:hypothetical protein